MPDGSSAAKGSSKLWIWWLALIVVFVVAASLAVLKPWEPDAVATPSPSPSVTPSPSESPSPAALTLTIDDLTVALPANLEWTGDYKKVYPADGGEATVKGAVPPFYPDGDYPGKASFTENEGAFIDAATGTAPPWFPDMGPFKFSHGEAQSVSSASGMGMDFFLIGDGLYTYTASDGTQQAWLLATASTDQFSAQPRWAICRFHVSAEVAVDAMYCDAAEHGAAGTTWLFREYDWTTDGDALIETLAPAGNTDPESEDFLRYTVAPGDGLLHREKIYPGADGSIATWTPTDQGLRLPTEAEVQIANGCEDDGDGGWVCPDY